MPERRGGSGSSGSLREADPPLLAGDAAAELRERYDELRAIEGRIADLGRDRVEGAADRYRQAHRVLDQYEDDATGTGDFGSYVKFESAFSAAASVDDDALAAEAFSAAEEAVDKRRLTDADFERARRELEPAGEYVDLLERRDEAIDRYREARRDATAGRKRLAEHVAELEELSAVADVDLDAPVERLREPMTAYNEAVRAEFRTFLKTASARELFELLELIESYPLVDADQPPADLREYVADYAAGEEPIPTLLEYADYSRSKLDHYVDDPGALRTAVAVHRTWLDRIDAEPFTLAWPPRSADELRYLVKELLPVVSRFADEETVAKLRAVRSLTNDDEFDRLRRVAEVHAELDDDEIALLADGDVAGRLERARDTLELVDAVLAETDR